MIRVKRTFLLTVTYASFLALTLFSCAQAGEFKKSEKTAEELRQMTQENLYADWASNRAFAQGVGRIKADTAQARLLARRAALVDAQRNLLLLRKKIYEVPKERAKIEELSGAVPPLRITGERMEEGLYFMDVEASLSNLLGKKFDKKQFQKYVEQLDKE